MLSSEALKAISNKAEIFLSAFSTDIRFVAPDSTPKETIKQNKNGTAILLRIWYNLNQHKMLHRPCLQLKLITSYLFRFDFPRFRPRKSIHVQRILTEPISVFKCLSNAPTCQAVIMGDRLQSIHCSSLDE